MESGSDPTNQNPLFNGKSWEKTETLTKEVGWNQICNILQGVFYTW